MPVSRSLLKIAVALTIAVSLSACASYNTSSSHRSNSAPSIAAPANSYLPSAIASQLEQAQIGQKMQLTNSPWGDSVTVVALSRYFAATGQPCLRLQVQHLQQTQPALVCQFAAQRWVERRAITEQFSRAEDTMPQLSGR